MEYTKCESNRGNKYAKGEHSDEDKKLKRIFFVQGNFEWEGKYSVVVHWGDNMQKDKIIRLESLLGRERYTEGKNTLEGKGSIKE